jgi:hypothetical protein
LFGFGVGVGGKGLKGNGGLPLEVSKEGGVGIVLLVSVGVVGLLAMASHLAKKVLNPIREKVSADRMRFEDGEYNLDLAYILPNIIGS